MDQNPHHNRTGLFFFGLYFLIYTAFVFASAFASHLLEREIAGVSLAVLAGLGLIAGAMGLAAVYCWVRRGEGA